MNLTLLKTIKGLMREHGVYPSKRFGQNFLIDKGALRRVIWAADLKPSDVILEIGPGLGVLTEELAKRVKKVIAVEKDQLMINILKETLKSFDNTEIILGDILKLVSQKNSKINLPENYKVVANLPYYIANPIIRYFLELAQVTPLQMILMVQKEVAQRICAKPPHMTLLAVSVQFYAEPKIVSFVSKKSFWPQPKVDGAIIKIIPKKTLIRDRDIFFKIVRAGFSQPRKQIGNNFSKKLKLDKSKVNSWLLKNGINPTQRAETLNIENWIELVKNYKI